MSKGFQGKFHRQNILSRFAKELVRRSRSKCELCDKSGVQLNTYELEPLEEEPLAEGCLFVCETCLKQINVPKKMTPSHWRCLNNSLWSDVPAVQVMSVRILRRLVKTNQTWAQELLDNAYLEPELQDWASLAD